MTSTWLTDLKSSLKEKYGSKLGTKLSEKYSLAFPALYTDEYSVDIAINDIEYIERLSEKNPLEINFYNVEDAADYPLHLRLFQWRNPMPLSDVMPMLENLDLRTYNEHPNKITFPGDETVWISDFAVSYGDSHLDIEPVKELVQEAFKKIVFGFLENDGMNKLIIGAALSWREVTILRTYAKYLHQIRFQFTQAYIEKTLKHNIGVTKNLIELFMALHNPSLVSKSKQLAHKLEEKILSALDTITSLDEDRIIRRLLELIKATLRTNFYQTIDKQPKDYLSIKFDSRKIPELPLPKPLYEIFVYSPRFEAIHLRNTKVARGGIRWSDRREDFRTEVLGLMKAQVVKNAVIVPSGAKGGFVLKWGMPTASREALQKEVIDCYKFFIRGLLDITDNIIEGEYVHPKNVVCYDDYDTYLVVAADKGTASFSDIANDISKEYKFWLGDAFASGGSTGYDHKKIGITARGAWESIKRHFRELDIDVYQRDITVIGIGDMSGDVFGNGMIYTPTIKLVAAFDHRNIFIDPNPDPKKSFKERVRLFNLPSSSWEDYNQKLISKGGGVYPRSIKSITITPEMKIALGIEESSLTPNDLIRAILKAPVDLFFNGGIGTYVKSKNQTNTEVGDRTNDYCRVNGEELRCRVVGEGGNLGFTQLGRVEYALKGGLINTDFIDNSGGVDCSDHEVNLKILLDSEIHEGRLTEIKRDSLLASLTDEVAALVLQDNYYQALVMSFSAFHAVKNLSLHANYIKELESIGILNRKVEFLPDDKQLLERKAAGEGLTRPELAILLAYSKIHIKQELLKSDLPEDPFLSQIVVTAFPSAIRKKYRQAMFKHRLHRDIISTQLSNYVVNEMGITFVYRLQIETGSGIDEIIRAHAVSTRIFGTHDVKKLIESLDFKIPLAEQYEMLFNIRNLINLSTRWFLHNKSLKNNLEVMIKHYSTRIKALEEITPKLMGGFTRNYLESLTQRFLKLGISEKIAKHIATYRAIYTSLNIIEVATNNNFDLVKTANVYFWAGERVNLLWFRDQLSNDAREGHWNTLARLTLRDELDIAQRALTIAIIKNDVNETNPSVMIDKWVHKNNRALDRWEKLLEMLNATNGTEYTMFFIAMRELLGIINSSQRK